MQMLRNMNVMAVISRPKLIGLGEHWGVLMPNGMVVHNTDDRNVHFVTLDTFASGKPVKIIREVDKSKWVATNWRLHQELHTPKKYHLTDYNCEIFANHITGEIPESPQVKGAAILSALLLFVAALK